MTNEEMTLAEQLRELFFQPGLSPTTSLVRGLQVIEGLARDHNLDLSTLTQMVQRERKADRYKDQYEITVLFRRFMGDDLEIVRDKYPGMSLEEALRQQLQDEIQEAGYDKGGMAGHFEIQEIRLFPQEAH